MARAEQMAGLPILVAALAAGRASQPSPSAGATVEALDLAPLAP
jgi:hypothetical protein